MIRSAVCRWNVITDSPTTSGSISRTSRSIVSRTRRCTRIRSATATRWWGSTFPASEVRAALGMRIAMDGMCSNESGIDSNKMFIGCVVLRAVFEPDRARHRLQVKLRVAEVETRRLDVFVQQVERVLLAIADGPEDLMTPPRHRQTRLARVRLGQRRIGVGRPALGRLPR